jgi:hypothetical protein
MQLGLKVQTVNRTLKGASQQKSDQGFEAGIKQLKTINFKPETFFYLRSHDGKNIDP